jgi:hypothetical protein
VITAALDVQRGQIRAESAGFISEEMIGQLENKYPELIFLRFWIFFDLNFKRTSCETESSTACEIWFMNPVRYSSQVLPV